MKEKRVWMMLIGSVLAGAAASACCVLPVLLLSLGIAGAWIANLQLLEPFRPFLLAAAWGTWGVSLVREWRR